MFQETRQLPIIILLTIIALFFIGISGAAADGNPANGATVFKQCSACHSTQKGVNKIGPSLFGVVGRHAGSIAGYAYSPAMQEAANKGLVWTTDNIVSYLKNPHEFLENFDADPGVRNKMPFFLSDPQKREDVVAYLKSQSGGQ